MRPHLPTLVLLVLLAGCHSQPPPPPITTQAPVAGRLTVGPSTVPDIKTVAAAVVSRDMGEARARIGGTLIRLNVREGDQVRAGQVIGVVQDSRLALETRALEAQVAQAQALAAQSAADLRRIRTLYDQGIYARARLDQALAAARSSAAGVSSAQAMRAASAELAAQGTILAPSSGRVTSAPVPEGSVVAAGQSVATLTAGVTLVRLEMPEAQAGSLHVGDRVRIDPASSVAPGVEGVIRQVYPSVQSGLVTADIDVPGLSDALVGQRISVQVAVGQRQAVIVPSNYIQTRYGLDYVRLVGRNGAVSEVPVQTAPAGAARQVEVLSGLAPGDVITPAAP